MITSGFFNSVDGDRRYNAEQMSDMFEGLIGGGVFPNVGDKFAVSVNSGMRVEVGSGRAVVNTKWVKSDASTTLDITSAHISLPRYTIVVLRHVAADRTVILTTKDGTPAASPSVPEVTRNATMYEICLAKILVPAAAVSIRAQDITDTRTDSTVCGYVAGLVQQVNTTTIYNQWAAAYGAAVSQMQADEATYGQQAAQLMASQQAQFMAWFDSLAENLHVDTYIQKYTCRTTPATLSSNVIEWSDLTPNEYSYNDQDIITVHINGLLAKLGTDYSVGAYGITLLLLSASSTADVEVEILKSRIGYNAEAEQPVSPIVTYTSPLASFGTQLTVQGTVDTEAYIGVTILFDDGFLYECTVSGDDNYSWNVADYVNYTYSLEPVLPAGTKLAVSLIDAMSNDPYTSQNCVITFAGNGTPTSSQKCIAGLFRVKGLDNYYGADNSFTVIDSLFQDTTETPLTNALKTLVVRPASRNERYVLVAYADGGASLSAEIMDDSEFTTYAGNGVLETILPWKDAKDGTTGNTLTGCGLICGFLRGGTSRTVVCNIQFPQNATKLGYVLLKFTHT